MLGYFCLGWVASFIYKSTDICKFGLKNSRRQNGGKVVLANIYIHSIFGVSSKLSNGEVQNKIYWMLKWIYLVKIYCSNVGRAFFHAAKLNTV